MIFVEYQDDKAEQQGIQIIEPVQMGKQQIKHGLGDTGTGHKGYDIDLEVFGVFEALADTIGKQGE